MSDAKPVSILIVDDHEENLIALAASLKNDSYDIVQASSANEALRYVLKQSFAVILLDVMMPEMDGFELAQLLQKRESSRHTPIIFLTALAKDQRFIYQGYRVGAVDYLPKPLEPDIVRAKVAVFVDLFRKAEQIKEQAQLLREADQREREYQIQDLKHKNEKRYKELAESVPNIVWTTDELGTPTYFNCRWTQYTGLNADSYKSWDLQGETFFTHDHKNFIKSWHHALDTRTNFEFECRIKRASDETFRWHLWRANPELGLDGKIVGWIGTCTDIDDQKKNEQKLRELAEEARHLNKTKDEFLAVISHELRTPLGAVIGWSELLLSQEIKDLSEGKQALEIIYRNGKSLANLVDDLLDVSRIISGKLVLTLEKIHLCSVIESVVQSLVPAIAAKNIDLNLVNELPTDILSDLTMGDSSRIRQIIVNLLTNAIKFTPEAGRVEIRLYEDDGICLAVQDTGIGIASKFLPHIFENFRQADSSTTRTFGGLGLGLAIVKQLVDLHGGTVSAESAGENQGATFKVKFKHYDPESEKSMIKIADVAADATSFRGLNFLVVDDDDDARKLVSVILKHYGANVESASSVKEAIGKVKLSRPDILLSDIGMPVQDGYELIRQLREYDTKNSVHTMAAALTAYASEKDFVQVTEAGFDLHIPKPVTPECLLSAVKKLTGGATNILH